MPAAEVVDRVCAMIRGHIYVVEALGSTQTSGDFDNFTAYAHFDGYRLAQADSEV